MSREIKFRGMTIGSQWVYGNYAHIKKEFSTVAKGHYISNLAGAPFAFLVRPESVGQFTGLKDKNGTDIYEGDIVRIRTPYRTTQTHEGDNIPNGSYTEPMEPGIRIDELEVVFEGGCFNFGDAPLFYYIVYWDLESIKDAISWTRQTDNWFDDPDEGDLQYLINEVAKVNDEKELIQYLSGIEIIGNIHKNPELLS